MASICTIAFWPTAHHHTPTARKPTHGATKTSSRADGPPPSTALIAMQPKPCVSTSICARVKSRIESEHNLCTTRTNSSTDQPILHSCRGKFGRHGTTLKVNLPHLRHLHKPQPDIHFPVAMNCVENQLNPGWTVMTMHMTICLLPFQCGST